MQPSAKYLIHADIRTSGVVERSDVVGAIFGQTEGLLGDELDLRDLQDSSKIGRIDVDIESEGGRSFGTVTVASGLDRVETAVLAAALETIERVGPCRAECSVTDIEDARAAKRRNLVERATELLTDLEGTTLTSEQIVEEVSQQARVEEITRHDGLPAGPRVEDSDAVIVVEGRADVRQLLKYGIRNAIAVEGTDIPETIPALTSDRKTTAFLDGDRGGDLILQELEQVGNVDYVAFAPRGQSVEQLDRAAILSALRRKIPHEQVKENQSPREAFEPTGQSPEDGATDSPEEAEKEHAENRSDATQSVTKAVESRAEPATEESTGTETTQTASESARQAETLTEETDETGSRATDDVCDDGAGDTGQPLEETAVEDSNEGESASSAGDTQSNESPSQAEPDSNTGTAGTTAGGDESHPPETLPAHVAATIREGSGQARLLDGQFDVLDEVVATDLFETLETAETVPETVVLDDELGQRVLDVAAQRGVGQIIATTTGEFVKRPTNVRVRRATDLEIDA